MSHPLGNTGLLIYNLKFTTFAETPLSLSNNISKVGFFFFEACMCMYVVYVLVWKLPKTVMDLI